MDYLWRKVSDKEKEKIRKEAKRIIDSFAKKLEKVKGELKGAHFERKESEREEGGNPRDFSKEIMFDNAPKKNKGFIIGEKGEW